MSKSIKLTVETGTFDKIKRAASEEHDSIEEYVLALVETDLKTCEMGEKISEIAKKNEKRPGEVARKVLKLLSDA